MLARKPLPALALLAATLALAACQSGAAVRATSSATRSLTVSLAPGHPLVASLPTPEVLTIDNPGSARTGVTVSLATSGDGIEQVLSSDKVTIPAGSSTQQLKATGNFSMPLATSTVPVTVTLSAAGSRLARQVTTLGVLGPQIRLLSGPKTMPRDGQAEFEFAVANPATLTYPYIYLALGADCGASGRSCHPGGNGLAGFHLAWLDGSTWPPLNVADNVAGPYGMVLRSGPLAPGTSIVRLRLGLGSGLDPRATFGFLQLRADLPMPAGTQGAATSVAFGDAQFTIS